MTLQFDPSPYMQLYQRGQENQQYNRERPLQDIAEASNSIGQTADLFTAKKEKDKQERLQRLTAAMNASDKGYDPNALLTYLNGGKTSAPSAPNATPTATPPMNFGPGAMMNPSNITSPNVSQWPQIASAGLQDNSNVETDPGYSQMVAKFNQFAPTVGHPQIPHPGEMQSGPFQRLNNNYTSIVNDVLGGNMDSYWNLPPKDKESVDKMVEIQRKNKKGDTPEESFFPQDFEDAKTGNFNAIASRHGGTIPKSFSSIAESASTKTDAAYAKKFKDAQDALTNVRGDESIKRTEAQRDAAIMAYNTISGIQKEGRMPSKLEYYDLLGQMWKARTGSSPTDQALKDLDQNTFKGDLGKAFTYITGQPAAGTTQGVLENLKQFVSSSGLDAEKLHEGYMTPRMAKIINGLKPEDQATLQNAHRGLSFKEATGYNDQGTQPIIQRNKRTGQIRKSMDGGKTWQIQ